MSDEFVTVPQAAEIAGCGIPSVYRWLRTGQLTRYKTGTRRTWIKRSELEKLLTPVPVVDSAHH